MTIGRAIGLAAGLASSVAADDSRVTRPATAACAAFSGWRGSVDDVDQRQYVNTSDQRTLLEYGGPAEEDADGPVAPGSATFGATFTGLKPGLLYRLRSAIKVGRTDRPYALRLDGLSPLRDDYRVEVGSGKSATIDVVARATAHIARIHWSTGGHNKMWAFVSPTTLCAEPRH